MKHLESRVLTRFNPVRDMDMSHTVYKTEQLYRGLRRASMSQAPMYVIWASPTGLVAFEDRSGNLHELVILRADMIDTRWNGPVSVWKGESPDLQLVTIEYHHEDYAWIVLPCLKAVNWVREQTRASMVVGGPLSRSKNQLVSTTQI
jgi:hypothetical protein